jgi:hypothetical protein
VLTRIVTTMVLIWEVMFPIFMMLPWWVAGIIRAGGLLRSRGSLLLIRFLRRFRAVMLLFGVAFHLGIFVSLELGGFGPYMICLYLPLLPWERWIKGK